MHNEEEYFKLAQDVCSIKRRQKNIDEIIKEITKGEKYEKKSVH